MKYTRYFLSLILITAMVAAADLTGEREVIFPEIAALAAGLWVVDKRVWHATRWQAVALMTAGALAGIAIVRFSPLPLAGNMALAFLFAAGCLLATSTTLVPLISACMLPVLLGADSLVYPAAVLTMLTLLLLGQRTMERFGMRHPVVLPKRTRDVRGEAVKWVQLLAVLLLLAAVPLRTGCTYLLVPPLVVTFVELSRPEAGLRKAPGLIFALLAAAAALGAGLHLALHVWLGLPSAVTACAVCALLFTLFELTGRIFAPAGAVALIPLIIPEADLVWYPLQAAAGAALFIAAALAVFRRPAYGRQQVPSEH